MIEVWLYTLSSVLVISLVSLVGAITLALRKRLLQQILLLLVSFSAGALLGDAFLHLLPELAGQIGFGLRAAEYILLGIIFFFVFEKFICWHHCRSEETTTKAHLHSQHHHHHHIHTFTYSVLLGDAFHNFIDGLLVAGSYLVSVPVGVATTIAVVFHEIPQEIGDFGVLVHGGFETRQALLVNFATALTAVLGAIIGLYLGGVHGYLPMILGITAGGFIYIASADLIPELQKEVRPLHSLLQLLGFLSGLLVMYLLRALGV